MIENWISYAMLLSVVITLQVRKISDAVKLLSFQSVLLAGLAAVIAWKLGIRHLYTAVALTLMVKAIVIPYILHYTIIKIDIKREVERFFSKQFIFLSTIGLALLGYYVTLRLPLTGGIIGKEFFPVSVILIFLGSFIMISHKKAIMQGIGLITIENGLFLVAMSLTYGMPLIVEMGIFFDLLIAVIIIGILSYRIHSTFDSLNTEKLKNLKG